MLYHHRCLTQQYYLPILLLPMRPKGHRGEVFHITQDIKLPSDKQKPWWVTDSFTLAVRTLTMIKGITISCAAAPDCTSNAKST